MFTVDVKQQYNNYSYEIFNYFRTLSKVSLIYLNQGTFFFFYKFPELLIDKETFLDIDDIQNIVVVIFVCPFPCL